MSLRIPEMLQAHHPEITVQAFNASTHELRGIIQPATAREEFLVALVERLGAMAAVVPASSTTRYDDDGDPISYDDLAHQLDAAQRSAGAAVVERSNLYQKINQLSKAGGMIASTEQRLQFLLDGINDITGDVKK